MKFSFVFSFFFFVSHKKSIIFFYSSFSFFDLNKQTNNTRYVELKNILARQPGPEVAEQLSVYQHNLKEKTRQMKAMASELNMHQAQVNEHRFEIERLTRELQDVKRKYYENKRKEQIKRDMFGGQGQGQGQGGGGQGGGGQGGGMNGINAGKIILSLLCLIVFSPFDRTFDT